MPLVNMIFRVEYMPLAIYLSRAARAAATQASSISAEVLGEAPSQVRPDAPVVAADRRHLLRQNVTRRNSDEVAFPSILPRLSYIPTTCICLFPHAYS